MKQLTIRLVLPITVLSFVLVTKWWYVVPVDARETYFWGFPYAFVGEGWQTSGALQFFIFEGLVDILIYFSCWFALVFLTRKLIFSRPLHKMFTNVLWAIASFVFIGSGIIIGTSYTTFKIKRDFDWEIITSGYVFIWQNTPIQNGNEYQPADKCMPFIDSRL